MSITTHETTLESIFNRRSHRSFADKPLDEKTVRMIIQAGAAAPSAHGKKPYRFARIDRPDVIRAIVEKFPWFAAASRSAANILVLGNPDLCVNKEYWVVDCAAAAENILLASQSLGLGAVWLGIAPVEENIRNFTPLVQIPDGFIPFSLIAIGHPDKPTDNRARPNVDEFLVSVGP